MIKNDTVLILGAGASRAYGFPLGPKLKAMIWNAFDGATSSPILWALGADRAKPKTIAYVKWEIEEFNKALLLSPDYSIDSFLEHQCDRFKSIGKVGIAACLLPLEQRTSLYDDWMKVYLEKDLDFKIVFDDRHWYQYLFNEMCKECKFEDFADNKLSIITFNYDRSLEYYLLHSLEAKYGKDIKECAEVLKRFEIIHVYGSLGELTELSTGSDQDVPYLTSDSTEEQKAFYYKKSADSIRIIPEERGIEANSDYLLDAHTSLREAKRIYFLGFGFLEDNMNKLFTNADSMGKYNLLKEIGGKCFGTAMGLSPHLKEKLATMGLQTMKIDLNIQKHSNFKYPLHFPDCNINDFLLHNQHSKLD